MKRNDKWWRLWSILPFFIAAGLAALSGCGGDGGTTTPIITPTPTPTPTPTSRTLTVINTSGSFDQGTGQFTQIQGSFEKFSGMLLPVAAPGTTPTPDPSLGSDPTPGLSVFTGTYMLNSGETGEFNLTVLADNSAEGVAVPQDFLRYQAEPVSQGTGTATIALQLNGSTGAGTIQLSSGDTGTISITGNTSSAVRMQTLKRHLSELRSTRRP